MKNIKKGVLVLAVLLMLTGCVKSNNSLDINKDKSMNLNLSLKVSNEVYENFKKVLGEKEINFDEKFNEIQTEAKQKGYNIDKKDENGTVTLVVKKKFDNIDELSSEKNVTFDLAKLVDEKNPNMFKVTKGFLKNTYNADLYLKIDTDEMLISIDDIVSNTPTSGDDETNEESETFDPSKIESLLEPLGGLEGVMNELSKIEFTFDVNLPSKNTYTNLDTKYITNDGKTLKFDFSDAIMGNNGDIAMQFNFELINQNNLYIIIAAGGAALLITIIIVIASASKKKKAKAIASEPIHTEYDPSIAQNVNGEAPVQTEAQNGFVSTVPEVQNNTEVQETVTPSVEPTLENTLPTAEEPVAPTFEAASPVYEVPVTPVTETPVYEAPVAPVVEAPIAPVVEAPVAPVMEMPVQEVAPVVEAPVAPVYEAPVAPVVETPVQEVAPVTPAPQVAEVPVPQAPANFEFTLPEETPAPVEVVPEAQGPVFVPETPTEAPVQQEVQEIKIDVPEAVDMNAQNIQ